MLKMQYTLVMGMTMMATVSEWNFQGTVCQGQPEEAQEGGEAEVLQPEDHNTEFQSQAYPPLGAGRTSRTT